MLKKMNERFYKLSRLLGGSALATAMLFTTSMLTVPAIAEDDQPAGGKNVGLIETPELSKLVKKRLAEVEKAREEEKAAPESKFVLVDVRSDREMSVSIIPGAVSKAEFEKNIEKYKGKTVIPYCTVGGRCGDFSRRLAQAGWTVRSYRGSILDWVQNELPLVTTRGEPTNRLHTNGGRFELPSRYQPVNL